MDQVKGVAQPLTHTHGVEFSKTLRIFVVKLGWVLVGNIKEETPTDFHLENAAVIRVWGTSHGLGELAVKGPLPETILDPCGEAIIPKHAILWQTGCVEPAWVGAAGTE